MEKLQRKKEVDKVRGYMGAREFFVEKRRMCVYK